MIFCWTAHWPNYAIYSLKQNVHAKTYASLLSTLKIFAESAFNYIWHYCVSFWSYGWGREKDWRGFNYVNASEAPGVFWSENKCILIDVLYINNKSHIKLEIPYLIRIFVRWWHNIMFRIITFNIDQEVLHSDLDTIMIWSSDWQLPFTTSKCKHMLITNIKTVKSHLYYLNTTNRDMVCLPSVCQENDLGIIFHNTLEFDKHINNKRNKATRAAGLICRTFQYCSPEQ